MLSLDHLFVMALSLLPGPHLPCYNTSLILPSSPATLLALSYVLVLEVVIK
jgi:hypothetical protein